MASDAGGTDPLIRAWFVHLTPSEAASQPATPHRDAAAAALHEVLSHILGVPSASLRIERTSKGKPVLVEPFPQVEFNMSHAGSYALIAVAPSGRAIGVDIEECRRIHRPRALLPYLLADGEVEPEATPAPGVPEHLDGACRVWVRKEAVLKALGTGFSLPPKRIPLRAIDRHSARLEAPELPSVTVVDVRAPLGYLAAIASPEPFTQADVSLAEWRP